MPESIDAVLVRAAELTADGQPHAAIALLRPVLTAHPDHPAAWCRLAVAHLDAGEPEDSLDAAKRAIVLGERSWAHRVASLALVELGRVDEAVVSAREAVRRDPSDWRCHTALAEALVERSPRDAVTAALRAVDVGRREARAHEVLGDVANRAGEFTVAKRAYRDALRLDPDNTHVRAQLARLGVSAPAGSHGNRSGGSGGGGGERRVPAFGRVHRTAVWLLLRRSALWLAVGSFVLVIAGMPRPSGLLGWVGALLALFVCGLTAFGWRALPLGSHRGVRALFAGEPGIAGCAVLLGVAVLTLVLWTVTLALGGRGMQLLAITLGSSAVAAGFAWYGVWRTVGRTR